MKTKTKLITGSVGMIFLLISGIVLFSAFRAPSENDRVQLIKDIRTYLDKNVKPIMEPQRVKLDQILSAEEKRELGQLNNRLRQLVSKRNASGIGFITADEFSFSKAPVFTPKQKAGEKESRDEMRRIMSQAWSIADKHEKDIDRLLTEKTNFFNTWERGITTIIKNYLDDKFLFIGSSQIINRVKNRGIVRYYTPVAFLLWDPQQRFVSDELIMK